MKSSWIFLSPHLDDAVLSCGGMIYELTRTGHYVEVWTVFAGDPPAGSRPPFALSLEERWQNGPQAVAARRLEDAAACAHIGASAVHFDLPDCIYRRLPDGQPLINSEDDLWQPIPEGEYPRVVELTSQLETRLTENYQLAAPLGMGGHIDHRIVRAAVLRLKKQVHFYPDYPYAARPDADITGYLEPGWRRKRFSISPTAFLAWRAAIELYPSQISSLWNNLEEMHKSLNTYFNSGGGRVLWTKPE